MLACPSCGRENPDGFSFCGFCAAPLSAPDTATALEERKVVSVLFCDLVGFTAASEKQDPEDVRARVRPYHRRLREEIERYGGTVEKFVGDAVMAAFGAPTTHEDDAERAVRAGLAILNAIEELNEEDPGLHLKVRVGVNTGEAVVALAARPERGDGLVTGDVVNTAARIQAAAPVDAVAVGEQTYRTTSHIFEYEPLEPVSAKGKSEPLPLWHASSIRYRYGSDSVVRDYGTPFVGRELEKSLLIGIFERTAQQRSVQLVTIVGEPGVGKSRLIAELFAYIDAKPELIRWRQGRCLPYGEGITFWALGEIVKAEAGILESDSGEVAAQKLEAAVPRDAPERQWLVQRLAPLVGIEAPPAERQELFTAWRRYFESLAGSGARVLVFEDVHWADEALLTFLEYLVEWAKEVPLLVLCAARPELFERRPEWAAGQRNVHSINLPPLTEEETAELVSHLRSAVVLTPELERGIRERSGGNPLYAEEFVRLLSDRGLSAGDAALPETVQALIAARLDTLPLERKSLLQDAAVVGKVFWSGAVSEMSGRAEGEVELALHELARKELVRPGRTTAIAGEEQYSFWHLLVRDVAYSQIPRADRARRHRAAAAWIERRAGERAEDVAEVLAHHYLQALELAEAAGDEEQAREVIPSARRFLALAGERALGLDTVQAEARLARALELTPEEDPARPELLVRWADAAFQGGRLREAADALDRALETLRAGGQNELAARALQLRSLAAIRLGEGHQVALASEAVALLESDEPASALVAAYAQLANVQVLAGEYEAALAAADRSAAVAAQLGLAPSARSLGYHGFALAYLGDAAGIEEMEEALEQALEQGAGRDAAAIQNNLGIARYLLDGPERSLAVFEHGIAFAAERGLGEAALALQANVPGLLAELGRQEEARDRARVLAEEADLGGQTHSVVELRAVELACRLSRGDTPAAAEVEWLVAAARAIASADITTIAFAPAAAAFAIDSPERASALLRELEQLQGVHENTYFGRQLPAMVRTALAIGDRDLARRLSDSLAIRYPLEEHAACSARAQLAESDGDLARAAELYAEAAARWARFGNVPERAYALFGEGRCLLDRGDTRAAAPLRAARELFWSLGFRPALAETEALLDQEAAPSSA